MKFQSFFAIISWKTGLFLFFLKEFEKRGWKIRKVKYIIELRALVAQLDRAPPSGGGGCGFDPRRVHHFFCPEPFFRLVGPFGVVGLAASFIFSFFFWKFISCIFCAFTLIFQCMKRLFFIVIKNAVVLRHKLTHDLRNFIDPADIHLNSHAIHLSLLFVFVAARHIADRDSRTFPPSNK